MSPPQYLNGNIVPRILGTLIAVSPLAIWSHDSFFSLCRVQGSSMEPTLFSGDIVVVRKSDGFWQRFKFPFRINAMKGKDEKRQQDTLTDNDKRTIEREQVLAFEREHCNSNGSIGLLRKPPTPVKGNIIVFKDPERFPGQWQIKRVVASGGETVSFKKTHKDKNKNNSQHEEEPSPQEETMSLGDKETKLGNSVYVPPYYVWVEGDNNSNSGNSWSKGNGPMTKKLLIGIAEYRLWPPWRMGELDNESTQKSDVMNNSR